MCLELVDGSHDDQVLSTTGNIGFFLGHVQPLIPSQWALAGANLLSQTPNAIDVPHFLAFCKYCGQSITTKEALRETRISLVFKKLLKDSRKPPVAEPILKEVFAMWRQIYIAEAA